MDRLQELVRLHRMGTGAREVARVLNMSPNTEREYRRALETEGLLAGAVDDVPLLEVLRAAVERRMPTAAPPQMVSTVDSLREKIEQLAAKGLRPQAIHDRLRLEDADFKASFWAVRAAYRRWRKTRGVTASDVAIPVETAAGDVAQVDFGYVGKLYDASSGQLRKAWVFVMVLGRYSQPNITSMFMCSRTSSPSCRRRPRSQRVRDVQRPQDENYTPWTGLQVITMPVSRRQALATESALIASAKASNQTIYNVMNTSFRNFWGVAAAPTITPTVSHLIMRIRGGR